jgi:cysteine desulfurase
VLRALGLSDELAHSSIRFTIGRYTTEADVDKAIVLVRENLIVILIIPVQKS